ncbi:MAG: hypothetical protein HYW07_15730 [Candidatus Latescibacteria bacterium]|nr:hypothetical protein [Candidatus Latescibacterota bacterium]
MSVCLFLALFLGAGLAAAQEPDTSRVFASEHNYLLSFPRLLWTGLVYPLGEFTIYAERTQLPKRTGARPIPSICT